MILKGTIVGYMLGTYIVSVIPAARICFVVMRVQVKESGGCTCVRLLLQVCHLVHVDILVLVGGFSL